MSRARRIRSFMNTGATHGLRVVLTMFSVFALLRELASTPALIAVALAGVAGVAAGELFARTRIHAGAIGVGLATFAILGVAVAAASTRYALVPGILGPIGALHWSAFAHFGALAFAIFAFFRCVGRRRPSWIVLEIILYAACIAVMLAAHRHGMIARPLWLSDWAWRSGRDPANVLMAIGGAAAVCFVALLALEARRGLTAASFMAIPIVAVIVVTIQNVTDLPKPDPANDLGLTEETSGDDAEPTPPGSAEGGANDDGDEGDDDDGEDGDGAAGVDEIDVDVEVEVTPVSGQEGDEDGVGVDAHDVDDGGEGEADGSRPPEQPNLDNPGSSNQQPTPMAVVLLEDDYYPPSQAFYFRQDVWSRIHGGRMVPAERGRFDTDTMSYFPVARSRVAAPPEDASRQRVRASAALLADHAGPFALEGPISFEPQPNPNPRRFVRSYRFESMAFSGDYADLAHTPVGEPDWSQAMWDYYTRTPDDPRYAALAQELIAALPDHLADDPWSQALTIKFWFDRNLIYSTRHRHARASDPTASFLFGDRTGYCVHFAHAAVYLWRNLGIPSRVGTGYMVPEENRRGSTVLIMGSDAHAWPEIYLQGQGWVILDIHPHQVLDEPLPPVDDDLSYLLGEMAREEMPEGAFAPRGRPDGSGIDWLGLLLWLYRACALAIVGLYIAKLWRRYAYRWCAPRVLPYTGYRVALDLLGEAGFARNFGESREAFARRVRRVAPSFETLTALHTAAALANPARPAAGRPEHDRSRWHRELATLRAELGASVRARRRLLGAVNPASIFTSR